tara:strand:+ start:65940 stop:67556 length:1617 start_codon:yes stop_codon:yes gene_type:complete
MKTKRNNRRNKNKTCRGGGTTDGSIGDKLTIYIEPYVKELNTSGYYKYECSPKFAPENCVSNTHDNTFKQTMVENYISNYQSNLIDSYIKDNSDVNFVSGFIKTSLNTSDKARNITNLWEPYFSKFNNDYDEAEDAKQDDHQESRCNITKSYNVVVSSHQHLIDKLLKWKSPKDLLKLNLDIRDNNDNKYTDKGKTKHKKMGMRNGMIIMFEFKPEKCTRKPESLTIRAFCEPAEIKKGKNKYLYPPTEEDLINHFDEDYIKYINDKLNELFNKKIGSGIKNYKLEQELKKKLPHKYRLYLIRHKYSIHNKNESQPVVSSPAADAPAADGEIKGLNSPLAFNSTVPTEENESQPEVTVPSKTVIKDKEIKDKEIKDKEIKDQAIKVLNSPLAYESTKPTTENILKIYKLKSSDHNIFVSSPLNRAIETLILFLNNNSNWERENPYENNLNKILGQFIKILANRCNGDIADKAIGKLSKTDLSKDNLGKCGEMEDPAKFIVPQEGGKRVRKTRKRKHKRKTRRRKNKKRKSRRRSIRRR